MAKLKKTMEMSNAIISTFKHNNYNIITAISEFIDNSTQSFFDNEKILKKNNGNPRIDIILEKSTLQGKQKNSLYISDNAGGMTPVVLLESLDIGKVLKSSSRNEFGMGLKTSAFWFCSDWSIYTKTLESKKTAFVNVKEEEAIKDGYQFSIEEASPDFFDYKSGTVISLDIFQKNRKISEKSLITLVHKLASHYRKDIEERNLEIRIAVKEKGQYKDIGLVARDEITPETNMWHKTLKEVMPIYWEKPIASELNGEKIEKKFPISIIDESGEKLKGNVHIISMEKGDRKMAGITFIRNGRVVEGGYDEKLRPPTIFSNDSSFQSMRIFIEIEVDSNWPISQQKDKLLISDDDRSDIYEYIKLKSNSVIKFARDYRTKIDAGSLSLKLKKGANVEIVDKINKISDLFDNDDNVNISMSYIDDYSANWFIDILTEKGKIEYQVVTHLILDEDELDDWIEFSIDEKEESKYHFRMNIAHRFFNPYTEDSKYLDLLQRLMFYLLFAEFLTMKEERENRIDATTIRKYINRLFKNDIK